MKLLHLIQRGRTTPISFFAEFNIILLVNSFLLINPAWLTLRKAMHFDTWVAGPCKGGVQGFWIQISNRPGILDSNFKKGKILDDELGFKFQSNFLGFIFQNVFDSGFKGF